ncbi:MAG: heavy metal translocating P-type ATPase [Oscillospiraceae bacterium]
MDKSQKLALGRIIVAAVLFAGFFALPKDFSLRLPLYLAVYLLIGCDVLWSAVRNVLHGQVFDENFLMAIASIGAFCIGDYPEAVAVILFYQTGELFQDLAVEKSRRSIASLMDIRPDSARVLRNGVETELSPEEVAIGETIVIRPGEKIPLDGVIIEGTTGVNTAALTGEALPADKAVGDSVISGCVNLSGLIKVEVKSEFAQSTVMKILDLVENASEKKARSESFITRFARYYTPCVVIAALLIAVLPPLLFLQDWSKWINQGLIFLVISCPCALVISVPLSFFGGIGGASRRGILIKGANYLEALAKVKTVVFDKTGTLTRGSFEISSICPEAGENCRGARCTAESVGSAAKSELLELAAIAESYSSHPIAEALVRAYGKSPDKARLGEVSELAGLGVKAIVDGEALYVGNAALMEQAGAAAVECEYIGTCIHLARGTEYLGHIVISDELKPDARCAIERLKACGVTKTVMLTGDLKRVGDAVAAELCLDESRTELLPSGKVAALEELLAQKPAKSALAFVGDGINDAPVLTRADVGIAMGGLGSDAAIEAADIVLMDDKPSKVAEAILHSRKTMRIVWQNIIFALAVKAIVLILGVFGIANMWFAVFADVGVMMLAIGNAMRALR